MSLECLATLAKGGLGERAHPRDVSLLTYALNHTSCWFPEAWGVCPSPYFFFFSVSSYSLSLCVLLPQLSDPKPFQGFQMTIIGEKDCAAFSFYFCFQSQRALQRPSCPPPIIPCPPLYDNQCDLLRAAAPTLTLLVLQSLPPDFSSFS